MTNFNYMTETCYDRARTQNIQDQARKVQEQTQNAPAAENDFLNRLAGKSGESEELSETGRFSTVRALSAEERAAMSMAEYKLYLYDKISSLPVHPWNMQDFAAVNISEAGFEAMKNDPEYERWVLDCLRANFLACDPWGAGNGGKYVIFHFGATKEECRVECWRPRYRDEERERAIRKKAQNSFWERKRKRRKALLAMYEELAEKKALSKRIAVSRYYAELAALPPEAEKIPYSECEALAMQIFSTYKANILLNMFRIRKF